MAVLTMFSKICFLAFLVVLDVMCDNPTVRPAQPFDPTKDAKELKDAMNYGFIFGTDEDAIINILTHRSLEQRIKIAQTFKKEFVNEDLILELRSELSGEFSNAIVALMSSLPVLYANQLKRVYEVIAVGRLNSWHLEFDSVVEIFLSLNENDLRAVKHIFYKYESMHLDKYLSYFNNRSHAPSPIVKELIKSFVNTNRGKSMYADKSKAIQDADVINVTAGLWGESQSIFHKIMMIRSFSDLRKIFEMYEEIAGKNIEDSIAIEFPNDSGALTGYLAIVQFARDKAKYFARRLKEGLDENNANTLTRIIVGRSEIDLADIETAYYEIYKPNNLYDSIKAKRLGDYGTTLLNLINQRR